MIQLWGEEDGLVQWKGERIHKGVGKSSCITCIAAMCTAGDRISKAAPLHLKETYSTSRDISGGHFYCNT